MKSTAALCLGLSVAALSRAPQQQFSTRTDLVAIDVHVTDANGRPVHGLESGDFEVFEGGQRRPILATIQNVLSAMGTTRHLPKAVIYVGAGIPLDRERSSAVLGSTGGQDPAILGVHAEYARRPAAVFRQASVSNVAVHTIDPGGLRTESPFNQLQLKEQREFLRDLSAGTGGISVADTNDFEEGVSRITEATSSIYLIGYEPVSSHSGVKRVEVRVNRQGTRVRTRSHFEPTGPRSSPESQPGEQAAIAGLLPTPGVPWPSQRSRCRSAAAVKARSSWSWACDIPLAARERSRTSG
jgi:hypothetical protein